MTVDVHIHLFFDCSKLRIKGFEVESVRSFSVKYLLEIP